MPQCLLFSTSGPLINCNNVTHDCFFTTDYLIARLRPIRLGTSSLSVTSSLSITSSLSVKNSLSGPS